MWEYGNIFIHYRRAIYQEIPINPLSKLCEQSRKLKRENFSPSSYPSQAFLTVVALSGIYLKRK